MILKEGSGTHFDPDVVDAFFAIKDEILAIKRACEDDQNTIDLKNKLDTMYEHK